MLPRRPLFRPDPAGPPQLYKTYHLARPLRFENGRPGPGSHWREATCQEVDCENYRLGWTTVIDVSRRARGTIPAGATQANYIRLHSKRRFTMTQAGDMVTFVFPPGQKCFVPHLAPVGREPVFVMVDGDWRGNPLRTKPVVFGGHRQFIDDMGERLQRVRDQHQKG